MFTQKKHLKKKMKGRDDSKSKFHHFFRFIVLFIKHFFEKFIFTSKKRNFTYIILIQTRKIYKKISPLNLPAIATDIFSFIYS